MEKQTFHSNVINWSFLCTEKIKTFFAEFHTAGKNGKDFKYATQLTKIAHREQVLI